jgi:hypothetical protein
LIAYAVLQRRTDRRADILLPLQPIFQRLFRDRSPRHGSLYESLRS